MNPAAGLKRMFSMHALVELLKALAKFFVLLGVALLVLKAVRMILRWGMSMHCIIPTY